MVNKYKGKKLTDEEIKRDLKELKIELLKQTAKRKTIKRQIARLLTLKNKKFEKKSTT